MTDHRFADAAPIRGARRTADGYLVAEAFVAREGVQLYRGSEVGRPEQDIVRVWRPRDEVQAVGSVRSYTHAPITMGHPAEFVTSDNWSALAKGEVGDEAEWRDGKLRLPLILKDASAISAVEAGTRELSAGYTCRLEFADGRTEDGQPYDAVQRDIRINHVAIVPAGRAGADCRIGDEAVSWGASPIPTRDASKEGHMAELRKIMVDGLSVETTDAGAQAIEKLTQTIAAKDAALATKDAQHADALAAKDAALAAAEAARDAALAKVLTDAALDARVAARAALVAKAQTIAPTVSVDGLSDAAIRKAVVVSRLGDTMGNKPEAYLDARFDILAEDATKADPIADAMRDGRPITTLDQEYANRNTRLADAWKQLARKEA